MLYTEVNISDPEIPGSVFADTEVRAGRIQHGGFGCLPRPVLPMAVSKEATVVMTPLHPVQSSLPPLFRTFFLLLEPLAAAFS